MNEDKKNYSDKWNENFPKWPVTRLAAAAAGGA